MARAKATKQSKRAVVRTEQETEEPGVWITQLKDTVNFGVRVYGSATKAKVKKATEHFAAVKHFVDVELKEIEAAHQTELLAKSAKRPSDSEA